MALERPGEIGAGPDLMAAYREQPIDSAAAAGIAIPGELPRT
jgi:hypothetical protein